MLSSVKLSSQIDKVDFVFQVKVKSDGNDVTDWEIIASEGQVFSSIEGIQFAEQQTYELVLRSINKAGLTSEEVKTTFTVDTQAPV